MKKRTALGMTSLQVVILLCLVCLALGVMGTGMWIVTTGTGLVPAPQPPTATTQLPPSSTPSPTATITLTPTQTEIPYEAYVPDGWRQYVNEKLEIWIPPEFVLESTDDYNAALIRGLQDLGQGAMAVEVEQNPPAYELTFHRIDLQAQLETAIYLRQETLRASSLPAHIDERFADLPITLTVVERKEFELYRVRGVRVMLQANYNGAYVGYAYYLVQDEDQVWELGCQSPLEDFYTDLPIFDRIAASFRTRP